MTMMRYPEFLDYLMIQTIPWIQIMRIIKN